MSDDSSVGHPGQQSNGGSGSSIDTYFNLNPDKFSTMPTGEFLQQAKEYLEVSESYEKAKQALLDLDERKKQLEDAARADGAAEQPVEQPPEEPTETPEEQPPEQPAEEPREERHGDDPLEHAIERAEEQPVEQQEQTETPVEHTEEHYDDHDTDHPQISRAEVDLGGGPAL